MTWFLKSKIKKQIKIVNKLNQELIKAVNRYNELVAEYNMMNNFVPILPQQFQQQSEQKQEQVEKQAEMREVISNDKGGVKQIITKGKKANELPKVMEM